MRTIMSENWSKVRPKRSLEHGTCEGSGMPSNCKCLTVDDDDQHDNPQLKKLKLGSERRAISPLKLPGQLAPANTKCRSAERSVSYGKEVVNRTEKRPKRKIEIRPPKPIGDDVFITGPNIFSQKVHLSCLTKRVSSSDHSKDSRPSQIQKEILSSKQTPERLDPVSSSRCEVLSSGKYEADRRPLVETRHMDNEGMKRGFKVDEATPKVSENDLRNMVGPSVAESRKLKVTRFNKFKPVTPASEKIVEDGEETGFICTSQSNMVQPKYRFQSAGGSRYASKCDVGRTSFDFSRPKSSIQSKSSYMVHSPKLELAPSCGVRVPVKHKATPALSLTTYGSEGQKNETSSADKLDYLGFEADKAKASRKNLAGRIYSTCSGKVGMVGLSKNSGIQASSCSFRDENHISNIPCSNQENRCESKVLNFNSAPYNDHQVCLYRDEVRKVLDLYKDTLERLQQEEKIKLKGKGKKGMQIYVDAAMQLKEQHKWLNMQKCVGSVPGVEVGDKFHRRAELVIIGLHSKFVAGIDFKKIEGTLYATSIVASGRYGDKNDSPDFLIYVGEGGNTDEKLEDQKLVRGNLALKNSIDKVPIRVIRSIKNVTEPKSMHANPIDKSKYFYDGLYFVRKCWSEREPCGNLVFKFRLERIQGQQDLNSWNTHITSRKSKKASHGPVVVNDISKGEESMPIRAVNAIDCEKPPSFKYTTKMMYHSQECIISKPSACDCLNGCKENIACSCINKNNCEVSVNNSVSIVYECGPICKCPPDCKNRMTQHGMKLQLEVFKAVPKEWGVRSRNFISEGRFICEYVGDLLKYNQTEGKIDFNRSAFDAGNSNDAENVKFGNVGRFIRHSCTPNLYAKFVLFDHEDKGRPHVMLFAAKNIPPRKELTFDYKLWTVAACVNFCIFNLGRRPPCKNQMTQHGLQLQVFKTSPNGRGVGSNNFMSEGKFICEYVGELLKYKQEEGRIDFEKSAIDLGNSNDADNVKFGKIGRFIRRSCSPNLHAKFVLFPNL